MDSGRSVAVKEVSWQREGNAEISFISQGHCWCETALVYPDLNFTRPPFLQLDSTFDIRFTLRMSRAVVL